ncbi:hypothetical protein WA1_30060 [Scytonema hofmannii PCC 7110]|uniref:Uncharacterized protein n=1 Tax=Scytonema hofmannii PCC 7110 TaxID=128403 RepID=A0A139X518_9CYAN|nr:hypothetical protein WA1_30060 [Scytonema hofmannii PCC 7110]
MLLKKQILIKGCPKNKLSGDCGTGEDARSKSVAGCEHRTTRESWIFFYLEVPKPIRVAVAIATAPVTGE